MDNVIWFLFGFCAFGAIALTTLAFLMGSAVFNEEDDIDE